MHAFLFFFSRCFFFSLPLSLSLFSLLIFCAINREFTKTVEQRIERATAYRGEGDVDGGTRAKREMREGLMKWGWRKIAESWNDEARRNN